LIKLDHEGGSGIQEEPGTHKRGWIPDTGEAAACGALVFATWRKVHASHAMLSRKAAVRISTGGCACAKTVRRCGIIDVEGGKRTLRVSRRGFHSGKGSQYLTW